MLRIMSMQTDQDFLLSEKYDGAADLNTRIHIQQQFNTNKTDWFCWLYDRLDLSEYSSILELGCGPGTLWHENKERWPDHWRIILSDLSAAMVKDAQQQLCHDNFTFVVIDTQSIPFPDDQFDAVLANGVFDHVPHRQQAFAEIKRVLKPGGRLYTSVGGRAHLQEIEALVKPFLTDADYGGDPNRFGLENGQGLLAPWFTSIKRHCYTDTLVFDHAGPIVAYVLSEADVRKALVGEMRAAFIRSIQKQLATEGKIQVTVNKGLLEACKRE